MGTILERPRKNGSVGYTAFITIQRKGEKTYRESSTFDRKKDAKIWMGKREGEIYASPQLRDAKFQEATVGDAIQRYMKDNKKEIGQTKFQVLNTLLEYDIAKLPCSNTRASDIVELAQELSVGRAASTVGNYISHLSAVFKIAKPAWNYPLERREMEDAQSACKALGLIRPSNERTRRPTLAELEKLLTYFAERSIRTPGCVDMVAVIIFAIFSTRRQSEICSIKWANLDEKSSTILVIDMKHPGQKVGNNVRCELPNRAIAVVDAMPRVDERVFPHNPDTISAAFTRACEFLEIDDLHFHDLRHEGISHAFELKKTIAMVSSISGHRSWQSLKRYTQIDKFEDKYDGWHWLDRFDEDRVSTDGE